MKIPSEKDGSNVTQRTPVSSRFKKAPLAPGEPAESYKFLVSARLPSIANLKGPFVVSSRRLVIPEGFVVPNPTLEVRAPTSGTIISPKTVIPTPVVLNFSSPS